MKLYIQEALTRAKTVTRLNVINGPRGDVISIESAPLLWTKFGDEKDRFNRDDKYFTVIINEDDAKKLKSHGWDVTTINNTGDPDDEPVYKIQVKLGKHFPSMNLLTVREGTDANGNKCMAVVKKKVLTEDTVASLNRAIFENVDIIIRPYKNPAYPKNPTGYYLNEGYFAIKEEFSFASKYEMGNPVAEEELEDTLDQIEYGADI